MTPDELSEAIQIAKATTDEMTYSRRVLAKAVLHLMNAETKKFLQNSVEGDEK